MGILHQKAMSSCRSSNYWHHHYGKKSFVESHVSLERVGKKAPLSMIE
ncbi:hypothetical protein HMPREF0322_02294 [Desulfitobacterium hafniense DP7]|uniref:Uncharacterized protein n=1 Tax=Desulfitobacterium hafniense DP7 TaxID=537010 RepID=G9XMV6_DESHA|nr:hypothetical protein HMPREF0322_02294 [Desulfitobacterium hafniense DP7]